jgi:hypothetical protein
MAARPTQAETAPVAAKNTTPAAAASATFGPTVKLHYTGVAPVRVKGPKTGRIYEFSRAHPDGVVDRRDAEGLMRIALFRRGA